MILLPIKMENANVTLLFQKAIRAMSCPKKHKGEYVQEKGLVFRGLPAFDVVSYELLVLLLMVSLCSPRPVINA